MKSLKYLPILSVMFLLGMNGLALAEVKQVDTRQMHEVVNANGANPDFIIIDVSPAPAYQRGHLSGAISIPVRSNDFEAQLNAMDKSKTYLVYCMGGRWTPEAVPIMERLGFVNVFASMEGLSGWLNAGYQIVSE